MPFLYFSFSLDSDLILILKFLWLVQYLLSAHHSLTTGQEGKGKSLNSLRWNNTVSVSSGCYNKDTIDCGGFIIKHLFTHSSEGWEIYEQGASISGVWFANGHLLFVSSQGWEKDVISVMSLLRRALILLLKRVPLSQPNYLPKTPPSIFFTLGVRLHHM